MPFLMLVGLIITIVIWVQVSWVWGLVTGFFLVGGLGWKILAAGLGFFVGRRKPGMDEFISAWESRAGDMHFGRPETHPPPGLYQAWRQAHDREGISAGDWMDTAAQRARAPKARGEVSGVFETVGRWEGVAEAHPEGVLVMGEHVWWESATGRPEDGREHSEQSETLLPWDLLESATLSGNSLELKPARPSMIFMATLTDFDDAGLEPWLQLLEQNGVSLERKEAPPP